MTDRSAVRQQLQPDLVSAVFDDPDGVDRALVALIDAGVPRDLIDIVVSPAAADHFYPRTARGPGRETFRYAGIGGLTGLILSSILSVVLTAWPGGNPTSTSVVQLLGPNIGTVGGAVIGALIGFFRHRAPEQRFRRAAEEPDAIVVVVASRASDENEDLAAILAEAGGREPRVERQDTPGADALASAFES